MLICKKTPNTYDAVRKKREKHRKLGRTGGEEEKKTSAIILHGTDKDGDRGMRLDEQRYQNAHRTENGWMRNY